MKIIFAAAILFASISSFVCDKKLNNREHRHAENANGLNENLNHRLKGYASEAKKFVSKNNFNSSFCFLIDMKIPSGKKRFFIYALKGDSVSNASLVTHGSGSETENGVLKFSNTPNSNATSLGKYKIGKSYYGKFGLAFKLYGLDASNSNAFARAVVLHAHPNVPSNEVFPSLICVSWGCPTVNPDFLKILQIKIENSNKSILLYIFY